MLGGMYVPVQRSELDGPFSVPCHPSSAFSTLRPTAVLAVLHRSVVDPHDRSCRRSSSGAQISPLRPVTDCVATMWSPPDLPVLWPKTTPQPAPALRSAALGQVSAEPHTIILIGRARLPIRGGGSEGGESDATRRMRRSWTYARCHRAALHPPLPSAELLLY